MCGIMVPKEFEVLMKIKSLQFKRRFKVEYIHLIVLGYLIAIFAGTLLLVLPMSLQSGRIGNFWDSLFMATSSVCITGLSVVDISLHYSLFGQIVILLMIQVGGIGFMTFIAVFLLFLRRKLDFAKRRILVESMGLLKFSGIAKLVKRILCVTFVYEALGALLLSFSFVPRFGFAQGVYFAIFHSISAFCNAGFDLIGAGSAQSLSSFSTQPFVAVVIGALIVVGGLGFLVWDDLITHRLNFKKYSLHTKLVLTTSAVLVVFGWFAFFLFEYNSSLSGFGLRDKIFVSLFHSISPRTAGFYMVQLTDMSSGGKILTMILMFVGGSSGSTAGGIKTTTLVILLLNFLRTPRATKGVFVFKRKIDDNAIKQASALVTVYFVLLISGMMLLSFAEKVSLGSIVFEVLSALSTAGMSFDNTTMTISLFSRFVIILLMLIGRVGCVAFVFGMMGKKNNPLIDRLCEKVQIG